MARYLTVTQKQARDFAKLNGLNIYTEPCGAGGTDYEVTDRTGKTVAVGWTEATRNAAKYDAAEHAERVLRAQAKRQLAAITGE